MTGTIKDYVGYGTIGARPVSPAVTAVTGGSALYYATDTGIEYAWDGSAWHAVGTGLTNPMTQANSLITSTSGGTPVEATSAAGEFLLTDPTSGTAAFVTGGRKRIFHSVLGTTTATIAVSSIPAAFSKMVIELTGRCDTGGSQPLFVQFNGDTGTNYSTVFTENGSAASQTGVAFARIGTIPGPSAMASVGGTSRVEIPLYAGTTFQKTFTALWNRFDSGSTYYTGNGAGYWTNTAAITSLLFSVSGGNFITGTTVNVYLEV